jgi:hypothetical protein
MVQPYCKLAIMAMQITPAPSCIHGANVDVGGASPEVGAVDEADWSSGRAKAILRSPSWEF